MSNYPPYQVQPYGPQLGPYFAPPGFQGRVDMQPPAMSPAPQNSPQSQPGTITGLSSASRPVTSREEAMGVAADFSGALMMFPDITHDRVYVKRWDFASGGPAFQEYAPVLLAQPQQEVQPQRVDAEWASIQDVQDLKDMVDKLKTEIERMKKPAGRTAVKNDADK